MEPGSVIGISGFGVVHGFPVHLIAAVRDHGARDLVVVTNSLGREPVHPVTLVSSGQVRKLVAAFSTRPRGAAGAAQSISPVPLEVELVPQGLLVERLRAAGAGLGPFYSPVGEDTLLAEGKERREFGGQRYVLEQPLRLDYALIYAHTADRAGNLVFRGANRNFGPSFAKAARVVIAEVDEIVEVGDLDPDQVDLPGIFVDRVVRSPAPRTPQWPVLRPDDERRDYLGRPGLAPGDVAARIAGLLPEGSYVNLGVGLPTLVSDHVGERHCERSGRPKVVRECEYPVTGTGRVDLIVTDLAVIERDERGLVLRECAPGFGPDDVRALTGAPLTVEPWKELDAGVLNESGASGFLAWRDSVPLRRKAQLSRKTQPTRKPQRSGG